MMRSGLSSLTQRLEQASPLGRHLVNALVTAASVLLCLLALPLRLPGMDLAGIGPNWLLIWVVAWSLKRPVWQAALGGLALGLLQDGLTTLQPTHSLGLMLVAALTSRLQKQRFLQEDFISVALIVFGMAVISETVMAVQFSFSGLDLPQLWAYHQRVALASAILSSLWAPAIYFPLNRWWQWLDSLGQP